MHGPVSVITALYACAPSGAKFTVVTIHEQGIPLPLRINGIQYNAVPLHYMHKIFFLVYSCIAYKYGSVVLCY